MTTLKLDDDISEIGRLTMPQIHALKRLGILTIQDLLRHFPTRYEQFGVFRTIEGLIHGEMFMIEGKVTKLATKKTWRRRMPMTSATVEDATGKAQVMWFSQPYIGKMIAIGDIIRLNGKVQIKEKGVFFANPLFEKISRFSVNRPSKQLMPVYSETRGISSRWLAYHIDRALNAIAEIPEILPEHIIKKYHLPVISRALRAIHFPRSEREATAARKRFAFEEIFTIQLMRQQERRLLESKASPELILPTARLEGFLEGLPFKLTKGQKQVLGEILENIGSSTPMARLLEGDVGSGKTIIAAAASYVAALSGHQVAYMAPTELLARQHFAAFTKYLGRLGFKIGLVSSGESRVFPSKAYPGRDAHISRTQLNKWVHMGDIRIVIGTHALIAKGMEFDKLALIIVDEQHRFGVRQRARLAKTESRRESRIPHFLSMTATPIPRTLALTIYGDLDLSVLDELPPGRKPITTLVGSGTDRARMWELMREEVASGRQAFVICPRIEEKDDDIKSVEKEVKRLRDIFPEFVVGGMHGKLSGKERDKRMQEFARGEIQVLVSTTVIEVGIDIPNATVMIVEDSDWFGLAQLHQLRGRIGRGEHQSTFIALTESRSKKTLDRLHALETAENGFRLAEMDLMLRGAGELSGGHQWGISDIGMEALKNPAMVAAARSEATALLKDDTELTAYPKLNIALERAKTREAHFE
ncbi:MAG: ATP-dependent DNA helicase RecG [Patescibacteria group bacterium]